MRIGEALKLKPKDFKFAYNKWLEVTIPLSKKRGKGPVVEQHILRVNFRKKSLRPFMLPLLLYVLDRTKEYPSERVWKGISRFQVWHRIKKLNEMCYPHLFRHSRLHYLAMQGATGPVLRDWAGWADLRPASKYVAVTGELAKKYADKIE